MEANESIADINFIDLRIYQVTLKTNAVDIQINTYISNLVFMTCFWNNIHQVLSWSIDWKANDINKNMFGSNEAKEFKQDSQNICIFSGNIKKVSVWAL